MTVWLKALVVRKQEFEAFERYFDTMKNKNR
jgi:hypothetical protein